MTEIYRKLMDFNNLNQKEPIKKVKNNMKVVKEESNRNIYIFIYLYIYIINYYKNYIILIINSSPSRNDLESSM